MSLNLKLLFTIFAVTLCLALCGNNIKAQEDDSTPRTVFYTYPEKSKSTKKTKVVRKPLKIAIKTTPKKTSPAKKRAKYAKIKSAPGAEIKVELTRNGVTDFVPLNTIFLNDDRVRLFIRTNFSAYVAIFNRGSSGKLRQLFPCQVGENFIQPLEFFQIPSTFKFTGPPGEETLVFLVSRQPIQIVNQIAEIGQTACQKKTLDDLIQTDFEKIEVDAESQGRDIEIDDDVNNEGEQVNYLILTEQLLQKTIVYSIRLRHE